MKMESEPQEMMTELTPDQIAASLSFATRIGEDNFFAPPEMETPVEEPIQEKPISLRERYSDAGENNDTQEIKEELRALKEEILQAINEEDGE